MKRTLDQFIEFTGMNTRTQTVFGDRCRQLEWVSLADAVSSILKSEMRSPSAAVGIMAVALKFGVTPSV
jgi:hypothetical protein